MAFLSFVKLRKYETYKTTLDSGKKTHVSAVLNHQERARLAGKRNDRNLRFYAYLKGTHTWGF